MMTHFKGERADTVAWLKTRLANFKRIMKQAHASRRDGWAEDAAYFKHSLQLLGEPAPAEYATPSGELASCHLASHPDLTLAVASHLCAQLLDAAQERGVTIIPATIRFEGSRQRLADQYEHIIRCRTFVAQNPAEPSQ